VGSGYFVDARRVLTAAHVVGPLGSGAKVRPLGLPGSLPAEVTWRSEGADAALLELTGDGVPGAQWGAAGLGLIDGDDRVACRAVGFPDAQVRHGDEGQLVRDTDAIQGQIDPMAAVKGGLLTVHIEGSVPTEADDPGSTPWAGISGAGLFADRLLVGVLVIDPDRYPPDRLLAMPLAAVAGDEDFVAALDLAAPPELVAVRADGPARDEALVQQVTAALAALSTGARQAAADEPRRGPRRINWPPRPLLPLVGRAKLVTKLKATLLAGEDVALYAGLPGAGKTAVAHHLIRDDEIQAHFANILWTWLGSTPDVKGRLQVWATKLGITPQECEALDVDGLAERIHGELAEEPSLLIVDDAWSRPHALAFKVGDEGVSRLVTTRLESVARAFASPGAPTLIDVLDDDEALALMRERAPTAMTKEPARAAEAMAAAGGLPLTIILLASYLEDAASGPPDLLREALTNVDDARFRIRQEVGDTVSRQEYRWRTFEAAMQLSQERLSAETRSALGSLALFPPRTNSFSRDAADRVGAADRAVVELYQYGLVNLVSDDPERYWMHQAVADYAKETAGDPTAYRRMAEYFIDYIGRSSEGRTESAWLDGLEVEQVNLGAALEWAEGAGDAETALRLASALFPFWYQRSRYTTGKAWIDRILLLPGADASEFAPLRAKVLNDSGNFAYSQGDLPDALRRHEEALALRRECDGNAVAGSLNNIALVRREQGELDLAEDLLEEACELNLAAEARHRKAGAAGDAKRHAGWRGINLNNLGRCAELRGNLDRARELQEESLGVFAGLENEWGMAMARGDLGEALRRLGERAAAERELRTSFAIRYRIKDTDGIAAALRGLAALALDGGDADAADRHLRTALTLLMDIADPGDIAVTLQMLARVRNAQGDAGDAAALLPAAARFRRLNGFADSDATRLELERVRDDARAALGRERFEDAWRVGEEAELHEVCNDALAADRPSLDEVAEEILRAALD
jgi:tetratricopeptide (TPR) repeat protein